jgi:hypothetical protein
MRPMLPFQLWTKGLHLEKLMISGSVAYIWELPTSVGRHEQRHSMKLTITFGFLILVAIGLLLACNNRPKDKSDKDRFEEILNDPRINSKEVGEREGIKYFQVEKNGKTGFRDLDGKIVIEPIYDMAEMFSEGFSAVQVGDKWGLIDESGKYIIEPKFEYLGSIHNGLASYRANDKYGFVDIKGQEKIKPQFEWVDEFSEGLCVVRNDKGKHGYIDTTGKIIIDFQFQHANKFENGQAKFQLNNLWGAVDKTGKIIVEPKHKYTNDF